MLKKSTLTFLRDLTVNNNRDWFAENRSRYEDAKADVLALSGDMMAKLAPLDTSMKNFDPKKTIFRIARDTRFSKNKEPYKNHFGIAFDKDDEKSSFYIHVQPGESLLAIGVYMPSPQTLKGLRRFIDDEWEEFSAIITHPDFRDTFGDLVREGKILKRVPTGFSIDSPALEYLKLPNFHVVYPISDDLLCSEKFESTAYKIFKIARPFNDFLNKAIKEM